MRSLLFLLLALTSFSSTYAIEMIKEESTLTISTPSLKKRVTRKVRLNNGLEAYLISDPGLDQSAAALSVEVGTFDDPEGRPGMAHFCEHMLFLGTSAYPEENGYQKHLTENGGRSNAYTSSDHTNYAFSVNHDAFEEALSRFSWFFRDPLFNPSGVDREMHAVDQEHAKNVEQDSRREYYAQKAIANPMHPFSRFATGNLETLQQISQDELREWYEGSYSSNKMHLVIQSPENINRLQGWAEGLFALVPERDNPRTEIKAPLFRQEMKGKTLFVSALKEMRKLTLSWELPQKFAKLTEEKPDDVVSHLLGHEGETSLLAQLKREGLAEELSAGGGPLGFDNFTFDITISLTAEGIRNINQVMERCFQAIARLRSEVLPNYVFDETKQMRKLNYAYQQRSDPFYAAMRTAREMIREPIETYPQWTLLTKHFDRDLVDEVLSHMTPNDCMVTLVAKPNEMGIEPQKQEPWLGARYTVEPITPSLLTQWTEVTPHPNIDLPPPNPLIPDSLELVHADETGDDEPAPKKIVDRDYAEVFFSPDRKYLVPETVWIFEIVTPRVDPYNAESLVLADLYVKAVNESLNSFAYQALLAGLSYDVERTGDGIRIMISGYSQKAHRLLTEILTALRTVSPTPQQFKTYKENVRLGYKNFTTESPLRQGGEVLRTMIYKEYITESAKAMAIKKVTYKGFLEYRDYVLDQLYVKGTLSGNLTEEQARAVWQEADELFSKSSPYRKRDHIQQEAVYLPLHHGPYYVERALKRQGNATLLMIQNGPYSLKRRAAQQLLATAIEEPFYSSLRTEQQTGYMVFSWDDVKEKQLYSFFATQSNSHDTRDLLSRFELLLESFLRTLGTEEFDETRFETIRTAATTKLRQPPKNLGEMSALLHSLAFEHEADFDWVKKRIAATEKLTFEEFMQHAQTAYGRGNRQRVAVLVHGEVTAPEYLEYSRIRSPQHLKKMSDYLTEHEAVALDRKDPSSGLGAESSRPEVALERPARGQ